MISIIIICLIHFRHNHPFSSVIYFIICCLNPLIATFILSTSIILTFNFGSRRYLCMSHTFAGNNTDVASVCRLVLFLFNNPQLSWVRLDHEPSACVGHDAWKGAGLPAPPHEVVAKGRIATLSFIRVRRVCAPFRKPLRSRPMFHHHAPHTSAC